MVCCVVMGNSGPRTPVSVDRGAGGNVWEDETVTGSPLSLPPLA